MSDLAPDGPAEHARTMIPMKTLYERIDHVRSSRKDLPLLLRNIAAEIPGSWTRKSLLGLASAMENNASAAELVAKFPHHCWLLTLQSSAATTDALTAMLEQADDGIGRRAKMRRPRATRRGAGGAGRLRLQQMREGPGPERPSGTGIQEGAAVLSVLRVEVHC